MTSNSFIRIPPLRMRRRLAEAKNRRPQHNCSRKRKVLFNFRMVRPGGALACKGNCHCIRREFGNVHDGDIQIFETKHKCALQGQSGKVGQLSVSVPSCFSHSAGNGLSKSWSSRVAGCVPARIASTMLGASSVRRRTRPRYTSSMVSALSRGQSMRATYMGGPDNRNHQRAPSRSARSPGIP